MQPNGLSRSDGKRPDGLSLVPWEEGKPLTWNLTIVYPLADSYVATAARVAGSAAEGAAACKSAKYTDIETNYMYQPIAVESLVHTRLGVHSCPNLVASFPLSLAMTERPAFCFSDSPFSFSVSMLFYFLIVL